MDPQGHESAAALVSLWSSCQQITSHHPTSPKRLESVPKILSRSPPTSALRSWPLDPVGTSDWLDLARSNDRGGRLGVVGDGGPGDDAASPSERLATSGVSWVGVEGGEARVVGEDGSPGVVGEDISPSGSGWYAPTRRASTFRPARGRRQNGCRLQCNAL
jgi:hypothetical protein